MSTRKGTAVFLKEILDEAQAKMLETMQANESKFAEVEDPEATADVVGVAAVIVQDLGAKRIKDYDFNWNRMLALEGETGPYLQVSEIDGLLLDSLSTRSRLTLDSRSTHSRRTLDSLSTHEFSTHSLLGSTPMLDFVASRPRLVLLASRRRPRRSRLTETPRRIPSCGRCRYGDGRAGARASRRCSRLSRRLTHALPSQQYGEALERSVVNREPNTLMTWLFHYCRAVNSAIEKLRVKVRRIAAVRTILIVPPSRTLTRAQGEESSVAQARLKLFIASRMILADAMKIISLNPLERM